MLKKKNISREDALLIACQGNGLEYKTNNLDRPQSITIVNSDGRKVVLNSKYQTVHAEAVVALQPNRTGLASKTLKSNLPKAMRNKNGYANSRAGKMPLTPKNAK